MKKTEPVPLSIIPDDRPPLTINPGSATASEACGTNFGSLLEKSNMKLTKWEDLDLEVRTNCISSNQVYNFVICNVAMLNIGG